MKDPRRRNKNIGTAKQGLKRQSVFCIPESYHTGKRFWENINSYRKVIRTINDKEYIFIVEKTNIDSYHACTIDDLTKVISFINKSDLQDLNLIVLRQPKSKEEILKTF